jgi:acetolactate synthase-1/2/3 large subunit
MTGHQRTGGDERHQTPMTGAEIFVRSLICEQVEVVFGYPGGATIGVYDALHDISDIKHVLTRHEQGATHAAAGYARATGKPGVCLVTSGPGGTNLVTALATAYMDSIPVVAFSGQVALRMIGNDAFQEADIVGITRPITKHNYLVRDVTELARTIKEAFYIATSGRPGPVLIDMPKDMMAQKTIFAYPDSVSMRSYNPVVEGNQKQIKRAAELLAASVRPVLYVGGGAILSDAAEEVTKLARKLRAPVTTTLHGLGAYP